MFRDVNKGIPVLRFANPYSYIEDGIAFLPPEDGVSKLNLDCTIAEEI